MIDEKLLIDDILKNIKPRRGNKECAEQISEIVEIIKRQPTHKVWIPTSDSLPKHDGEYMDYVERTIICEIAQNEIRDTLLNCYGKTIPKKVIKTDSCSQACPICKNAVNKRYCGNCGQKLDYISELND